MDRTGIDPGAVDDVIMGCCDTIGSQAGDVARTAWLVAGLPDHVPGVTIDRQCGSSPAGRALRRAGRHVRHPGPRRRGRPAEHVRDPDLRGDARGRPVRLHDAVRGVARLAEALRRPGGQPVQVRRDDRREVGHQPRGHGGVRARVAPACPCGDRRGPLRQPRSRRSASSPTTRGPRDTVAGEDGRRCSRWHPAAGSPPPSPRRSATRRARCSSPRSRRSGTTTSPRAPASTTCPYAATTRSGC